VQQVDSVLIVSGKALRFTPDQAYLASYMKNNPSGKTQGSAGYTGNASRQGQGYNGQTQGTSPSGKKPVVVWVKSGDKMVRTRVVTGAMDGANFEIRSGLREGDEVVLSMSLAGKSSKTASSTTTTSPFMPQRPGQGGARR
jgi:HlyD family secretion protein